MTEQPIATEQPIEQSAPSLGEAILRVVGEAPLSFGDIKKGLKVLGLPMAGKDKISDDQIRQSLDAEIASKRIYLHPKDRYAAQPPLTERVQSLFEPTERKSLDELVAQLGMPATRPWSRRR